MTIALDDIVTKAFDEMQHPRDSRGRYVDVSSAFSHPFDASQSSWDGFSNANRERVAISDLVPTQDKVHQDTVDEWKEEDLHPVQLKRVGGKLYVLDGHHRIVAAQQQGHTHVTADVVGEKLPGQRWKNFSDEQLAERIDRVHRTKVLSQSERRELLIELEQERDRRTRKSLVIAPRLDAARRVRTAALIPS